MEIDLEKIKKEINKLTELLKNNNNHQECLYLLCNINSLQEIYRIITGEECEISIPTIVRVEESVIDNYKSSKNMIFVPEEKSVSEEYKELFMSNKEYYQSLSNNVLNFTKDFNLFNGSPMCEKYFFELLTEFLDYYDKRLLEIYRNLQKNGLIDFRSTGRDTFTANIFMLNKPYVVVNKRMDINGLNSFVHELGHVYSYKSISSKENAYNDIFNLPEFYSSYMELMFMEFLKSNNVLSEDASNLKKYFLGRMRRDAKDIDSILQVEENHILDDESKFLPPMLYFESAYLSIVMNDLYLKDKEGTKERIDAYLTQQGLLSHDESLELLGTSKSEMTDVYTLKRILK